jgi:protein TonB
MSNANLQPGEATMDIAGMIDASSDVGSDIGAGAGADRDAVPLVRVEPEYPMRARQRGIEGWVMVRFNVNKAGAVADPAVVKSHPGTIFDKAALAAVRRWRYNPKIQQGKAVERHGLETIVSFDMER